MLPRVVRHLGCRGHVVRDLPVRRHRSRRRGVRNGCDVVVRRPVPPGFRPGSTADRGSWRRRGFTAWGSRPWASRPCPTGLRDVVARSPGSAGPGTVPCQSLLAPRRRHGGGGAVVGCGTQPLAAPPDRLRAAVAGWWNDGRRRRHEATGELRRWARRVVLAGRSVLRPTPRGRRHGRVAPAAPGRVAGQHRTEGTLLAPLATSSTPCRRRVDTRRCGRSGGQRNAVATLMRQLLSWRPGPWSRRPGSRRTAAPRCSG